MDIGKFIRRSVTDYLNNPIIMLPFAIMGLIGAGLSIISQFYLHSSTSVFDEAAIKIAIASGHIPMDLLVILGKYFSIVALSLVSSFFHAFSIGLAQKIAKKKKPTFKDGSNAFKFGFKVFSFKVLIWLFTGLGIILITLPTVFLFGSFGLLLSCVFVFFFSLLLQFVGFFGKQAIVLEKLGAWSAFQRSFKLIRKNLENVLLLLGAYIFFFAVFLIFKKIAVTIANYVFAGFSLVVFTQAANFIFTFLILSPIFVIIKTSYFIKKSSKRR